MCNIACVHTINLWSDLFSEIISSHYSMWYNLFIFPTRPIWATISCTLYISLKSVRTRECLFTAEKCCEEKYHKHQLHHNSIKYIWSYVSLSLQYIRMAFLSRVVWHGLVHVCNQYLITKPLSSVGICHVDDYLIPM